MKIMPKYKKKLIESALGKIECDLAIENANILNLFTGEIYKGDVGIYDGFISHIRVNADEVKIKAKDHYDAKGKYLIPGLIDAHIHIESTMMTPRNFAEAVIPNGTTTVITDPHEIANVCGIDGVKYMIDNSKDVPMNQFILAPSCVPSVPGKENAGAEFQKEDIEEILNLDRVIGLGEVMDFLGVINNDKRMVDILNLVEEKDLFIQGHAPYLSGKDLSAYMCAGPTTDHESRTAKEAVDKMRVGMYVDARDSSISKNVEDIVNGVGKFRYLDYLTLCTDDREAEDILENGHMNDVVKSAIKAGMNPIDAIRSASLNIAREINIRNLGAIAPGYVADMLIVDSLEDIKPESVFFRGELVAQNGKMKKDIKQKEFEIENINTVYADNIEENDFKIKAPIKEGYVKTNVIKYRSLKSSTTDLVVEELPVKEGYLDISHDPDLKYVIVINRHKGFKTKGYGVVRNFGTKEGAIASTVSHDSHNLTICYDNPKNGHIVAKDLIEIGGGISCSKNEKFVEHLSLPIAGLLSKKTCKELAEEAAKMKRVLRGFGLIDIKNPLLRIATLALPVIPNAKMSDLGIIDVLNQEKVDLFLDI
ncbi:adenine deaminase [Senegalia massiliensis]|uniref:Adenine deaminase n=1 Tax=Senegalia massiliensis TaxID=1720316 RepID=A0A845QRV9_9CLOT|nr:adenine deaminase [Senegalia massiliensis]NBI05275.1 adenine deaminase [Senegalia massiliensis]